MTETTIEEAVKMMEEKRLLNLPVKEMGRGPTPWHDTIFCGPGLASILQEKIRKKWRSCRVHVPIVQEDET